MKQITRLALSTLVALAMLSNWWLFYGSIWMDEENHVLFGLGLYLLFGSRAVYVVVPLALGWEVWELWQYSIRAFTPGQNCYQADTLLDLVLPILPLLLLNNVSYRHLYPK